MHGFKSTELCWKGDEHFGERSWKRSRKCLISSQKKRLKLFHKLVETSTSEQLSMISIIFVFDKQAIESTLKVQPIIWYEESNL